MQILTGTITALSTAQTAKVLVKRQWMHPIYKKTVRRDKTFACHYDQLSPQVGDLVELKPCAPVSKTKKFVVSKIIKSDK